MPILKTSPNELAIHGGGPAAFESKLPAIAANVGNGHRFAELAERMFMDSQAPGRLAEEFEGRVAEWLEVRNVVGFSSNRAAISAIERSFGSRPKMFAPAFEAAHFPFDEAPHRVDCEPGSFGMSPTGLAEHLREDASAVFATHALGRAGMVEELEDICDEWGVPLFISGPQALGCRYKGDMLGGFGRGEIFELGRDQLVHAMDATVIATDDDLLAHRLRTARSQREEGIDAGISDAAAAMGIANLESAADFINANRARYELYRKYLLDVPGVRLVRHERDSTFQCISIEVDPSHAGITKDSLHDVLAAENVGTVKPVDARGFSGPPVSMRLAKSLLRLPHGPTLNEEAIAAVCKLIELAIVRSLESPDPLRLAA